uniref:Uncharacterized protein n=1 Tax=viral metagenome TaxID=1070528 RepID=A0A6C0ADC0_9ZZZZ
MSGDGNTIITSAYNFDDANSELDNVGKIYIYKYNGTAWNNTYSFLGTNIGNTYGSARIGFHVDVSYDGYTAVAVGLYSYADGGPNIVVLNYDIDNNTWNDTTFQFESGGDSLNSAGKISVNGNGTVIAASVNFSAGTSDLYIYKYSDGEWNSTKVIEKNVNNFGFYSDLSFNGNILAVGSTYEEVETDNYGKIYMYKL